MRWTDSIGNRVKLRDLHILLAVAASGSMGKAAGKLAVSQPVVSKAISDLEYVLGVRLLDRRPQGVEVTAYGAALVHCGRVVFDELRQGAETIEFLSKPGAGQLRLGCTEPLAAGFVGAVVEQLSSDYPDVAFEVATGDPLSLTERELRPRNVEVAITPTEGLVPSGDLDAENLFDDRQVIVTSMDNKWARRRSSIRLAELLKEPWILPPPDTLIGASIAKAFQDAGVDPPRPRIETFSIPLCLRLLARGRFVAMLPVSMVTVGAHLPLKVLPLRSPVVSRPTGLITVRNRTRSPLAELFMARARKLARPIASIR